VLLVFLLSIFSGVGGLLYFFRSFPITRFYFALLLIYSSSSSPSSSSSSSLSTSPIDTFVLCCAWSVLYLFLSARPLDCCFSFLLHFTTQSWSVQSYGYSFASDCFVSLCAFYTPFIAAQIYLILMTQTLPEELLPVALLCSVYVQTATGHDGDAARTGYRMLQMMYEW
jgi:hypothetical protein